jgi:hypothetical protein
VEYRRLHSTPNLALGFNVNRSLVDLPGGSFTADLARLRLTVALSTNLVANTLLQYNAFERDLGANLRIGYTFRPGSDLFLGFNERRGILEGYSPSVRWSEPVAKWTWQLPWASRS